MQCMMTAATAVGGANGMRAWIGHRFGEVLTPSRMRAITIALFAVAMLVSGLFVGG